MGGLAGRGRRAGMYRALLLAVYDPENDRFQTICKCGTGFSDAELAIGPPRPPGPRRAPGPGRRPPPRRRVVRARGGGRGAGRRAGPVAAHTAGWGRQEPGWPAVPRFTGRWRDDKAPTDATTVSEVVELYRMAMRLPEGTHP